MRSVLWRRAGFAAVISAGLLTVGVAVPAATVHGDSSTTQDYTVAFNQTSGLPSDVDSLVSAAGGTITVRIPEIGGIGVSSSNPNFAAQMAQSSEVKSAD